MKITKTQVEHVAKLARLELTEAEAETFTGQLNAILSYVEKLNELNTGDVIPMAHAVPMENAFRNDEVATPLAIDEVLANAPESDSGFFKVPKVIE